MRYEFELSELRNGKTSIMYAVKRKGLCVGYLTLEEPYNKPEAKMEVMQSE